MIDERLRIAGHLIRRAQQTHDSIFAEMTAGFDVTSPQMAALSVILWNPGIDLSALSKYIGYDAATLGSLVNRLVAKRLINRRIGRHDRRTRVLSLTQHGEAFLKRVLDQAARVEDQLLGVLSTDERQQFMDMLLRVVEADELRTADSTTFDERLLNESEIA